MSKRVFLAHRFDYLDSRTVSETADTFRRLTVGMDVVLVSRSKALADEQSCNQGRLEPRKVVIADLLELKACDVFLMDVSIDGWNYIGVTCEMVYAHICKKPIIAYVGATSNGERVWLRYHANIICHTFDEVKSALHKIITA